MEYGICVASRPEDIDYVVEAERLGFTHAWMADSQMIWSDVYAMLALAAVRTSTINLGMIQGGTRSNIVADSCKLRVDIRTTPGLQRAGGAMALLTDFVKRVEETASVTVASEAFHLDTDPSNPFVQKLIAAGAELTEVGARGVEVLDPVVEEVRDIDRPVGGDGDAHRRIEEGHTRGKLVPTTA